MNQIPQAQNIYPENYDFSLSEENLKVLAKTKFRTHSSIHAERLHRVSEFLLQSWQKELQLIARVIEPLPGKNKNRPLLKQVVRIACVALAILNFPLALLSLLLASPLRLIDHRFRPAISYIDNSQGKTFPSLGSKLHVRNHNIALVPESMGIVSDLRPTAKRAHELVNMINGDTLPPDVIFFQEAFHEEATLTLSEGIKEKYPYILHNVSPQISNFSSGLMVASKYPIQEVKFGRMESMLGPERLAPKGILRIKLQSENGPVFLYGVHTQALIGEDRAQARTKQIDQIKKFMDQDLENNPGITQILMGDFNTSTLNAWGESNIDPENQSEGVPLQRLDTHFRDPFLDTHDKQTGNRTGSIPAYLKADNQRLERSNLPEPTGSWQRGPFENPGVLAVKMERDRKKHNRDTPKPIEELHDQKSHWGTKEWFDTQLANTARFDYILLPKDSTLNGRVEIRRNIVPVGSQSACSDHLPVDGEFWI